MSCEFFVDFLLPLLFYFPCSLLCKKKKKKTARSLLSAFFTLAISTLSLSFALLLLPSASPPHRGNNTCTRPLSTTHQNGDAHPGLPGHDGRARAAADGDARRRGAGARRAQDQRAEADQDRPGERATGEGISYVCSSAKSSGPYNGGRLGEGKEANFDGADSDQKKMSLAHRCRGAKFKRPRKRQRQSSRFCSFPRRPAPRCVQYFARCRERVEDLVSTWR